MMLLSFLLIQAVKKAPRHETVVIFKNPDAHWLSTAGDLGRPRADRERKLPISYVGHGQQEPSEGLGPARTENCKLYTLAIISRKPGAEYLSKLKKGAGARGGCIFSYEHERGGFFGSFTEQKAPAHERGAFVHTSTEQKAAEACERCICSYFH